MSTTLRNLIKTELLDVLNETFEKVQGIYLDKNSSLFETLDSINAEQASRPVSATCATIAAQVEHVRYYLDVLIGYAIDQPLENINWGEIWETISTVTEEEWQASKDRLKASYQRVRDVLNSFDTEEHDKHLSDMLAILVHTAYHLGEIRQAMCTVA